MTDHRRIGSLVAGVLLIVAAACGSDDSDEPAPSALNDDAVTVASFNFPESQVLAEIYSQALEAGGYEVRRALSLGPREFVEPALAGGLVELVPEYAGTALQFLSAGATASSPDAATAKNALQEVVAARGVTVLASAPAQDANTVVVPRETAELYGLRSISDLQPIAPELTFGGPPECPTRPLCLLGLENTYGLRFKEFVPLDAGGPLTRQALRGNQVDAALMFTTDPAIATDDLVELEDDLRLQPAENVTPLLRNEVIERFGDDVVRLLDAVSARLTTAGLRELNAQLQRGASTADVARAWLETTGAR